jgi:hypothetical protein
MRGWAVICVFSGSRLRTRTVGISRFPMRRTVEDTCGPSFKDIRGRCCLVSRSGRSLSGGVRQPCGLFGRAGQYFVGIDGGIARRSRRVPATRDMVVPGATDSSTHESGSVRPTVWTLSVWSRNLLNKDYTSSSRPLLATPASTSASPASPARRRDNSHRVNHGRPDGWPGARRRKGNSASDR